MFRVPTSKFNDLTFLFDQYIHTLDGKSGSMRLVHDAKFISANTSLFCHFWRRCLFLFAQNIFIANMTELITNKVLRVNFFDFFFKEFLLLNSQTDKLLTNIACDMLIIIIIIIIIYCLLGWQLSRLFLYERQYLNKQSIQLLHGKSTLLVLHSF